MRKIMTTGLWCMALVAMATMQTWAATVDAESARQIATQFVKSRVARQLMSPRAVTMSMAHVEPSAVKEGVADYYVLNATDGNAFVIVAGDDRWGGVLACGDRALEMDQVPCNMQWLLNHYKRQMSFLRAHPDIAVTADRSTIDVAVSPLVSCVWNQRSPYYNQCPVSGTQHCLTGCVATAMAQVMYYWKYPAEAPAMEAYTASVTGASVPGLPGGPLDWDNMLDEYTTSATAQQQNAVAMLMRYCGQACKMSYGPSASGAYSDDELEGMKMFGYNADAELLDRDDYSAEEWNRMMLGQLESGCPILYGGVDADKNAGHAFVVDGYGGGMYHINWGWSGSGNGYFLLDAFTTMGLKYSSEQQMLYQVYPTGYLYGKQPVSLEGPVGVGSTSFTATWSDETPSDYVSDYTLYIQPYDPAAHLELLREGFSGVDVNLDATTALSAGKVGDYCDNAGWTGSFVYLGAGKCFIVGGQKYVGWLATPPLGLNGNETVTVRFKSRYFGSDESQVIVTCGDAEVTIALTRVAEEYVVVFNQVAPGSTVKFGCTGRAKRFYIDDVVVTTGDDRDPTEMDIFPDDCLVMDGITSTEKVVTGLVQGGFYRYVVVSHFEDGTSAKSNWQLVTLNEDGWHDHELGDVNHDGMVTISDVTMLIDYLLGGSDAACPVCGNVNGDSTVSIADVTVLIDRLLS